MYSNAIMMEVRLEWITAELGMDHTAVSEAVLEYLDEAERDGVKLDAITPGFKRHLVESNNLDLAALLAFHRERA